MPSRCPSQSIYTTRSCYSSVLHRASCSAHKNYVIRGMKARKFQEKGIVFQSMGQVKRYEARCPIFFLHNFGVQFIGGILKKFFEGKLKACMKPVTRGCNLWPWKERLKERMSFKFWFSQKLNIKLFLTLEPLFLLSFFKCYLQNTRFQLQQFVLWPDEMRCMIITSTGINGASLAHYIS